jgi:hypothetical protein
MRRKEEGTVLNPDTAASIRAIFVHDGSAVTVDEAASLLGWPLDTMDAAIKWHAIKLDERSKNEPRISRRELLEAAIDQWSLAEIKAALSRDEWKKLVSFCGAGYGALVIRDRDTLRAAAGQQAEEAAEAAALLRPEAEPAIRRRAERKRKAAVIVPDQFKRHRRRDGVREVTMSALSDGGGGLAPMLRLRGRWLAALGFKKGMRVYIVAKPGALLLTSTDPTQMQEEATAQQQARVSGTPRLALAAPQLRAGSGCAVRAVVEG